MTNAREWESSAMDVSHETFEELRHHAFPVNPDRSENKRGRQG